MPGGQIISKKNIDSFLVWSASMTDDGFRQIIFRGQLNRTEISKAIGCGKSALTQNPELRKLLTSLEDKLRKNGVLPLLTEDAKAKATEPKPHDYTARRRQLDSRRLSTLEQENIELKAKLNELEKKLQRYGELSNTLSEMGFMPR